MLKDTNNGMIEIWVVMAIEVVIISCTAFYYEAVCTWTLHLMLPPQCPLTVYYYFKEEFIALLIILHSMNIKLYSVFNIQVFGASDESDGRKLHPFFLLGFKLGPDDPKGWSWFLPRKLPNFWMLLTRCQSSRHQEAALGTTYKSAGQAVQDDPHMAAPSLTPGMMEAGEVPGPLSLSKAAIGHVIISNNDGGVDTTILPTDHPLPVSLSPSGIRGPTTILEPADVSLERTRVDIAWEAYATEDFLTPPLSMIPPQPAVLLRNLHKVYPSTTARSPAKVAVADLSLMVGHRESFGLLGPNGAGKTTTLRMMEGRGSNDLSWEAGSMKLPSLLLNMLISLPILLSSSTSMHAGMLEPSSGSILVCGINLADRPRQCALQVSYLIKDM